MTKISQRYICSKKPSQGRYPGWRIPIIIEGSPLQVRYGRMALDKNNILPKFLNHKAFLLRESRIPERGFSTTISTLTIRVPKATVLSALRTVGRCFIPNALSQRHHRNPSFPLNIGDTSFHVFQVQLCQCSRSSLFRFRNNLPIIVLP